MYPTAVVMMVVQYYYRFKVSLNDVVDLMLMRGFTLSHQTVHNWVQTFGVDLGINIRDRRYGYGGKKWHVDATYIKVEGRWCYLYRAIDTSYQCDMRVGGERFSAVHCGFRNVLQLIVVV